MRRPLTGPRRASPRRVSARRISARRIWGWVSVCASGWLVVGWSRMAEAEPILHERVFLTGLRCRGGVCTVAGPGGEEVRAVEQNGQLLPAPTDGPSPVAGEQIFRPEPERAPLPTPGGPPLPGDPPPERRAQVRMDRDTGPDAAVAHTYHAVFSPSEFPYKRMSALDWANEDESLALFDASRRPVTALGASARRPDYDAFWGSVVVDLEPDRWVPLPSVSSDARLLEYRTDPPTRPDALQFGKDGADNFFVRATSTGAAGGRRRLIWLTDAPQAYFGGPIPEARLDEEPRTLLRPLPPRLKKVAHGVLDALGIVPTARAPLRSVLDPLVAHFRAFDTAALPDGASDSTYRDIALSRHGVCRHRSYAFVLTALAAGLPARYVENELHVFVEVYLPRVGWRRINLGGAALDDRLVGGDDKPAHRPAGDDGLPRPAQFLANATPPDHRLAGGEGQGTGRGRRGGAGAEGRVSGVRVDLGALLDGDDHAAARRGDRIATRVSLAIDSRVAYRGDTVEVSGRVVEESGAPAGDLSVEIYLDGSPGAERVSETRTGADGRFAVVALVPPSLALGSYSVVARTPGDRHRLPASSRLR